MKTFKEYVEKRDLELYNEIDWKGLGRKAVLGGALLGGMLGMGGKAYAPNQEKVPYDFGNDSLLVSQGQDLSKKTNLETPYQVDSERQIKDVTRKDSKGLKSWSTFRDKIRSYGDKNDFTAVHTNTPMIASKSELTSYLPKDIKNYMKEKGLSDSVLTDYQKQILNKDVNKLTPQDKSELRTLSDKLIAHADVQSPRSLDYLAHGAFGKEGGEKAGEAEHRSDQKGLFNAINSTRESRNYKF